MMTVYKKFTNLPSAVFAVTIVGLLSGCTTTQPSQPCTSQEAARLHAQITPTNARLDRNKIQISRIRAEQAEERCTGNLFAPANKSPKCERLKTQEAKLVSENQTLSERLSEINAAIAGMSHPGKHVKSCSANWLPKRSVQKAAPSRKLAKASVKVASAQAKKPAQTDGLPVEDYVVPAYSSYSSSATEPVAYTASAPVLQAPAHIAPVEATPPVERAYSDSAKVRVIGSSFFPDQSKPANPQAPDHAPAP